MSLLSIPSLVKKNIAVIFLPWKAILIGLEDECAALAYARMDKDGLFCIDDYQNSVTELDKSTDVPFKAMMALVKRYLSKLRNVSKNKVEADAVIWHRQLRHVKAKADKTTIVK